MSAPAPQEATRLVDDAEGGEAEEEVAFGVRANRGLCTDTLFLLLWCVALAGFGLVAWVAVRSGNPWRLLYGTDYLGNVCGKASEGNAPNLPPGMSAEEWGRRDRLWYPFGDVDDWHDGFKLGLCVEACPDEGTYVDVYGGAAGVPPHMPKKYHVDYNSANYLRRCLPGENNTALVAKIHDIVQAFDVSSLLSESIAEIGNAQQTLYYSLGVVVGASAVWLLLVYCAAIPMLVLSILAVLGGFVAAGVLSYEHGSDLSRDGDAAGKWFTVLAYVAWALGGLLAVACLCLAGRIKAGADVVKYSSRLLLATPSIVALPLIHACLLLGWIAAGAVTALYIETMNHEEDAVVNYTAQVHHGVEGLGAGGVASVDVVDHVPDNKTYLHIYNTIFFFWTAFFITDIHYLTTSLVASFWYWHSDLSCGSPFVAIATMLRHHLGTCAFGSAILTLGKGIRYLLTRAEKLVLKISGENGKVEGALRVVCCCLCCLECCLKFLTEKAYCVTAVEGSGFCSAAQRAVSLVVSNVVRTAVIETVATVMSFIGKLLIVGGTGAFAYFCLVEWGVSPEVQHVWQPLVFVVIMAYLIASVFVDLFGMIVDTLMISSFIDREMHVEPRYGHDIRRQLKL
eukprot:TRINITY_DN4089_c0_g2_i1.p1 TRINITY_DN4089_c0_g2~~TRINITY_DN4089_c0_g2_i1.p1  ORF type:complete len:624 (+),score=208.58 TRINITY_DN4089_c0_g2_i1:57-1928(+)